MALTRRIGVVAAQGVDDSASAVAAAAHRAAAPPVQFSKTKMCKFQILGVCSKSYSCPFAHDSVELNPLPDLRCTKLCKTLIQTGECNIQGCSYAHSKEELRTTSASASAFKTKPCRFFTETGQCSLGSKCNFAHHLDELRASSNVPSKHGGATKQQRQNQQPQMQDPRQHPKAVSDPQSQQHPQLSLQKEQLLAAAQMHGRVGKGAGKGVGKCVGNHPMRSYGLVRPPPPVFEEDPATVAGPLSLGSPKYVADFAGLPPWDKMRFSSSAAPSEEDVSNSASSLESSRVPPMGSVEWQSMMDAAMISQLRLLENASVVDQRDGMLRIMDALSATASGYGPGSLSGAHLMQYAAATRLAQQQELEVHLAKYPSQTTPQAQAVGRSAQQQIWNNPAQWLNKSASMRPVRTSQSTLCSLSDQQ